MIIKEDRDRNLVPTMRASFRMKIAEIARLTCSEWKLYPGGHENIDFCVKLGVPVRAGFPLASRSSKGFAQLWREKLKVALCDYSKALTSRHSK